MRRRQNKEEEYGKEEKIEAKRLLLLACVCMCVYEPLPLQLLTGCWNKVF